MKKLLLVFLVLTAVFAGCKKDDMEPDRDKFIGSWTGTQTVVTKGNSILISNETAATTEKFDVGLEPNEIIINKGTDDLNAKVTGSVFDIPQQLKYTHLSDGTIVEVAITGSGTISSNGVLTASFLMTGTVSNVKLEITITETLNKN